MPIITLTTDLGNKDYYLSQVKAKILSQSPDLQIVDVTHQIDKYDVAQAAFVLKNILDDFPKDTVHIVGVGTKAIDNMVHLGIRYKNQYIITADSGLFNLIARFHPDLVVELQMNLESDYPNFPVKDLYAPAAVHLATGGTLEVIGRRTDKMTQRVLMAPTVGPDQITGSIIYVDDYVNAISNITTDLIKEIGKGREYALGFVSPSYTIEQISMRYSDVTEGERLALINSAGHLEIAMNQGRASDLIGLHPGTTIVMQF